PRGCWSCGSDGSRAPVDQSRGIVQGALDLMQTRLAQDRFAATHPAGGYAPPPVATSYGPESYASPLPDERTKPKEETGAAKRGTEGGVGVATVAQIWSG